MTTPKKPLGAKLAKGGDDLKAVVTDQAGNPKGPIAVKSGEFVFSVEAIIGAGHGDYEKGLDTIKKLHDKLKGIGHKYLKAQGYPTPK
jgi:hypothetical protein